MRHTTTVAVRARPPLPQRVQYPAFRAMLRKTVAVKWMRARLLYDSEVTDGDRIRLRADARATTRRPLFSSYGHQSASGQPWPSGPGIHFCTCVAIYIYIYISTTPLSRLHLYLSQEARLSQEDLAAAREAPGKVFIGRFHRAAHNLSRGTVAS